MAEIEKLMKKLEKIKGSDAISRARRQAIIQRSLELQAEAE